MGRGWPASAAMWMLPFLTECAGTRKALERIYKTMGEGIFCFFGKWESLYYFKKWSVKEELVFSGYKVSVLQDETVLEIGCTTMRICLTVLNWTLKNG